MSKLPDADPVAVDALAGVLVVALEQAVAAPLCSRHLGDLGAEVIKVEHPVRGDLARSYDTAVHGESAYFVWLNRGKRSVSFDLQTAGGRTALLKLLDHADVFLSNLSPGSLERLGFESDELRASRPRLITCSISGYGESGPYREQKAFDLLVQGEAGLLSITGTRDEPAKVGVSIADISAGMYAVVGILAALRMRDQTGLGQHLPISMFDCLAEWMSVPLLYETYAQAPLRMAAHHATIAPYGPYVTRDAETIIVAVQTDRQWRALCESVLELSDLAADPRFSTNESRVTNRALLEDRLTALIAAIDSTTLIDRLRAADLPFGRMNSLAEVLRHPQLVERQRWAIGDSPSGPFRHLAPPLGRARSGPVPSLGADTAAVVRDLGIERDV